MINIYVAYTYMYLYLECVPCGEPMVQVTWMIATCVLPFLSNNACLRWARMKYTEATYKSAPSANEKQRGHLTLVPIISSALLLSDQSVSLPNEILLES